MTGIPYQQGNAVTLDATFYVGSTPTDPTTISFHVRNPDGSLSTYTYPADPQVTRLAQGSYECALGVPVNAGQYHYEAVATGAVQATLPGEFFVIPSSVDTPIAAPGPVLGPGRTWINGEDITNCAGFDPTVDAQLGDAAAVEASMILYELSGRQFDGLCAPITVRPSSTGCNHWGDMIYGGYTWVWSGTAGGWGWGGPGNSLYGCGWLSRVELAGYPVREIQQVKFDGAVLPALDPVTSQPNWRLDGWRHLTRMDAPGGNPITRAWPACQNLALNDDQPATFSVTYTYGVDPPPLGIDAARQLACQILLAQNGKPCQLPVGVTRIVKQGVTIDRGLLTSWGRDQKTGAWQTGLSLVDAFLNTYNSQGLRRRPAVFDFGDTTPFAPKLGT